MDTDSVYGHQAQSYQKNMHESLENIGSGHTLCADAASHHDDSVVMPEVSGGEAHPIMNHQINITHTKSGHIMGTPTVSTRCNNHSPGPWARQSSCLMS